MGGFNISQFNTGPGGSSSSVGAVYIWQLLRSSFRCIGQLLPGFGYAPNELTDALFILNAMLDSWAADDLNAPCTIIQSFPITSGIGTYAVGPGATWSGLRPTRLTKATLVIMTNPVSPLRKDLKLLNADQWENISLQSTQATLTNTCFYNPTYPYGTANFWPVPTETDNIELSSMQPLAGNIPSDQAQFIAPPGYLDAVRYQLAVRLAMEWNKPLKDGVAALAIEALAVIQRLNATTPQLQCNPGVMQYSSGGGDFNWLDGEVE